MSRRANGWNNVSRGARVERRKEERRLREAAAPPPGPPTVMEIPDAIRALTDKPEENPDA